MRPAESESLCNLNFGWISSIVRSIWKSSYYPKYVSLVNNVSHYGIMPFTLFRKGVIILPRLKVSSNGSFRVILFYFFLLGLHLCIPNLQTLKLLLTDQLIKSFWLSGLLWKKHPAHIQSSLLIQTCLPDVNTKRMQTWQTEEEKGRERERERKTLSWHVTALNLIGGLASCIFFLLWPYQSHLDEAWGEVNGEDWAWVGIEKFPGQSGDCRVIPCKARGSASLWMDVKW